MKVRGPGTTTALIINAIGIVIMYVVGHPIAGVKFECGIRVFTCEISLVNIHPRNHEDLKREGFTPAVGWDGTH